MVVDAGAGVIGSTGGASNTACFAINCLWLARKRPPFTCSFFLLAGTRIIESGLQRSWRFVPYPLPTYPP